MKIVRSFAVAAPYAGIALGEVSHLADLIRNDQFRREKGYAPMFDDAIIDEKAETDFVVFVVADKSVTVPEAIESAERALRGARSQAAKKAASG